MELLVLLACALSTGMVWGTFYLVNGPRLSRQRKSALEARKSAKKAETKPETGAHAKAVGEFYDRTNEAFLKVYGDVIQAFRTRDLGNLLGYQANVMQLQSGMKVLDAGCGVGGPAMYFAQNYKVHVDAITASEVQMLQARERIKAAGLESQVQVKQGDYHQLSTYFPSGEYDVVYFLESFGHSPDKAAAIASAWEMLKPGGMLYVKDLFVKEPVIASHREEIQQNVARINEAYRYHVGDLNAVLTAVRQKGFILSALKTIDIPLEDFENLTISNDFQELTGIHRIDNLQAYLFPVDFFELICIKPWHDVAVGNSRYFLQNLYYLKVKGKVEAEL